MKEPDGSLHRNGTGVSTLASSIRAETKRKRYNEKKAVQVYNSEVGTQN